MHKDMPGAITSNASFNTNVSSEESLKAEQAYIQQQAGLQGCANPTIQDVLKERGSRYGKFKNHAALTTELKLMFTSFVQHFHPEKKFTASQLEALNMIFHKIGRIGNGDPNYADSWTDIAGYAQLVADELNGVER